MTNMRSCFSNFSKFIFIFLLAAILANVSAQADVPERRQDTSRTCLNYGHACWGAHGKRSDSRSFTIQKIMSSMLNDLEKNPRTKKYDDGNSYNPNELTVKKDNLKRMEFENNRRLTFVKRMMKRKVINNDEPDLLQKYLQELRYFPENLNPKNNDAKYVIEEFEDNMKSF